MTSAPPSRPREPDSQRSFGNSRLLDIPSRPLPAVLPPRSPTGWLSQRTPTGLLPMLAPPQVVRRYTFDARRSPMRAFLRQISVSGAILLALVLIAMSAAPSNSTLAAPLNLFSATYGSAFFPTPTSAVPAATPFGGTSGAKPTNPTNPTNPSGSTKPTNPTNPAQNPTPAPTTPGAPAPVVNGVPAPVTAVHIVGNQLYDGAGRRVTLRGASRWSLEFNCSGDGHFAVSDFQAMQSWGMNVVRIPMNSSYWLNGDGGGCSAQNYRDTVANAVKNAESVGMYVMLVGQWSVQRSNSPMAYPQDRDFLAQLAQTYKNDYNVGFVPVTEPHDVSWDEWYNGWNGGPGMVEVVNILNTNAPGHIIFVNGLGWGNDMSFLTNGHAITGPNIAYEVHIYQYWNPSQLDPLMSQYVILGGEFGINDCCHNYVGDTMAYFEAHHTGYMAWAWADDQPVLLLNGGSWNGTSPTPLGAQVRDFILAHQGQ